MPALMGVRPISAQPTDPARGHLLRTSWFSRDTAFGLAVATPLWGVGGLVWGLLMLVILGGNPLIWLFAGIFWAVSCWFFFSIWLVIATRELVVRLPMIDVSTL